jgi:3-oxoacyl-[acyl-carrier-protein] synthase II
VGRDYQPEEVGLFGATGLAGLPLAEVRPLIQASLNAGGAFDLARFGQTGLRSVNPILSFKILSNMPLCFVSICENIQGPNAVYAPWEGQGAQAIEAGVRALKGGEARCVVVGGCDVKTHELAFLGLEQQSALESWKPGHAGKDAGAPGGVIPGEGAAFLVMEREADARARGARTYARLANYSLRSRQKNRSRVSTITAVLQRLGTTATRCAAVVAAANGDSAAEQEEAEALAKVEIASPSICPKKQTGDLFAAAAALQVGLGALLAQRHGGRVLANCFGHGSEQAAFELESP